MMETLAKYAFQISIPFRNTLIDTPENKVLLYIWASTDPVK